MEKEVMGFYQVGDGIVVELQEEGTDGYSGTVFVSPNNGLKGFVWDFDGLRGPKSGKHIEENLAESAVSFGGYYTTYNRGDDLPDWAPPAEVADAINEAYWGSIDTINGHYPNVAELECLPEWCYKLREPSQE